MKFMFKRYTALILAIIMVTTALVGCGKNSSPAPDSSKPAANEGTNQDTETSEETKEPTHLTILSPDDGRVVKEDNEVWVELEKRTNTELELMLIPGGEMGSKLNTMAASDTLPDIIKYADFFPYVQQEVVLDITDIIAENAPNMQKYLPESVWEYTKYQGKTYAIPYYNEAGKSVMAIRQDWLNKLGLETPKNLDDLYEVAVKFANEDPDGNNEKDTYAFANWYDFMPVFGAYGIIGPRSTNDGRYFYIEDGKAYSTYTSPQFKEALVYLNKLWEENLIDPDFLVMQADQYNQKLAQGKIGMITNWWSTIPETLISQLGFYELNPGAEWTIVTPDLEGPGGPFGNGGMYSFGDYQNATWISANSKNQVEAIKFLDYLFSDEGYELAAYGIKGVHYNTIEEGRTEEGKAAFDEKWLDSFAQIVGKRIDIGQRLREFPTDEKTARSYEYQKAGLSYNLYTDAFFGLPATEADLMYGADLAAFEAESRIAFLTGERSLDEYDAYVEEWLSKGGAEIMRAKVELYNEIRGEKLENGMQR